MRISLFSLLLFVLTAGCGKSDSDNNQSDSDNSLEAPAQPSEEAPLGSDYDFKYDINNPSFSKELPFTLMEVSGLSLDGNGGLLAVQDEMGSVFKVSKDWTVEEVPFRKPGDYEGIEKVGDDVWVVKNTGTLYKITDFDTDKQAVEKFKYFLDDSWDVEGLGYDKASHSLLLACKSNGVEAKTNRSIFEFDIKEAKLEQTPRFRLSLDKMKAQMETWAVGNEDLQRYLKKRADNFKMAPSSLAIHPITGDYYITSSKGKLLGVFSSKGDLLHVELLDKLVHTQPEGLVFDADGTLYISNEGKDKTTNGFIHKFEMKK